MATKHRNADTYLPEDLIIVGVDIQEGPMMDLLDERIFGDLDENLIRDIHDKGVIQSITCRRTDAGLEVIDGRRRVMHARAVNEAKAKEGSEPIKVPVIIKQLDDLQALELQLSLNTNRKEESQITLAKKVSKFVEMMQSEPGAYRRAAVAANVSEVQIRNLVRFAKMDPEIHSMVESGKLGFAAAITLSADSPEVQLQTARQLASEGQGGDVTRAREVRQRIVKETGQGASTPGHGGRGRPRKDTVKPSVGTIKDVLFLHGMDTKSRSMSYGEVPEGFAEGVNWVMGFMEEVPDWLQSLIDRVEGKEASRERRNARYDNE